jgi:hypothetical protein
MTTTRAERSPRADTYRFEQTTIGHKALERAGQKGATADRAAAFREACVLGEALCIVALGDSSTLLPRFIDIF